MRNKSWIVLVASAMACLAAGGIARAADSTAAPVTAALLPAAVAADLKSVADECTEVGGKPHTGDAVKSVDLNGDGHADYVLDVGSINCEGAVSIYGDRAKAVWVYAGDGGKGASTAFNAWVYGMQIEGSGPAAKLWLTVSGEQCGKPPAPNFASENFCERALQWNPKSSKFDYAPVTTVRMIK